MSLWSEVDTAQVVRPFFAEAWHRAAGPAGRAGCDRVHDQLARFLARMDVTEPLGREAMIMLGRWSSRTGPAGGCPTDRRAHDSDSARVGQSGTGRPTSSASRHCTMASAAPDPVEIADTT